MLVLSECVDVCSLAATRSAYRAKAGRSEGCPAFTVHPCASQFVLLSLDSLIP